MKKNIAFSLSIQKEIEKSRLNVESEVNKSMNELGIYRKVIPWQSIIDRLVPFYCEGKGPFGVSLRIMVAIASVRHTIQTKTRYLIQPTPDLISRNLQKAFS
jgi:hypothetical protein